MFFFDLNNDKRLWFHLHGFATNVFGSKIEHLRSRFSRTGEYSFFAMDMDYEKHTTTEVLDVVEALIEGFSEKFEEIVLCGSSHGGYIACNLIRFRDFGNVKSLVLLAPSFETLSLIVKELGEEKVKRWLRGEEPLRFVEEDMEIEVRKDFARDILQKGYEIIQGDRVLFPESPSAGIYIIHGEDDEIVPIQRTELFCRRVKVREFVRVKDDHQLSNTFPQAVEGVIKRLLTD